MNKKYRLVDFYENWGVVAESDNLKEIEIAQGEWEHDTDGECFLVIQKYDKELQDYKVLEND